MQRGYDMMERAGSNAVDVHSSACGFVVFETTSTRANEFLCIAYMLHWNARQLNEYKIDLPFRGHVLII